jgi:hypothetical protein
VVAHATGATYAYLESMPIDPDLKAILTALADGQLKLEASVGKLADGQTRLEATVAHMATATESAFSRTDQALERLTERIDSFRDTILKGFTNGADRDRKLEDDVRVLDARVTKLEGRGPKKSSKRK